MKKIKIVWDIIESIYERDKNNFAVFMSYKKNQNLIDNNNTLTINKIKKLKNDESTEITKDFNNIKHISDLDFSINKLNKIKNENRINKINNINLYGKINNDNLEKKIENII